MGLKIIICTNIIKYVQENRLQALQELHGSAIGSHKGITKTYRRVKQKYFWENLKQDVQSYVNNCLQCQLKKLE